MLESSEKSRWFYLKKLIKALWFHRSIQSIKNGGLILTIHLEKNYERIKTE